MNPRYMCVKHVRKHLRKKQDLDAHMEYYHLSLVCATDITCQCTQDIICGKCLSE